MEKTASSTTPVPEKVSDKDSWNNETRGKTKGRGKSYSTHTDRPTCGSGSPASPFAACTKDSAGLPIGCLGQATMGPDELDLTSFSGYKFRSASAKGAYRSSAPRARNQLKSALVEDP
ncbi:hypothetical protein TNCV_3274251 [Trichonephila clavipes]|nr:hypothetical protein TNCV_3274251 [Trichonephila clavipes]